MSDDELRQRVRELRSKGLNPKAIARTLGLRPAEASRLVRETAEADAATRPAAAECWVSAGWSSGLDVPEDRGWPDRPQVGSEVSGLVGVLVARQDGTRVSACGYLVDAYCLGVKDAVGPRRLHRDGLADFRRRFFSGFGVEPLQAPVTLARELVWGAVAYARELGFSPHPDFDAVADHLEPLDAPPAIGFGRNGRPFYAQGPFDDAERILRTLRRTVGEGNFGVLLEVGTSGPGRLER